MKIFKWIIKTIILLLLITINILYFKITQTPYGKMDFQLGAFLKVYQIMNKLSPWQNKSLTQWRYDYEKTSKRALSTDTIQISDLDVPYPDHPVKVRLYQQKQERVLPCLVFLHGGGFTIGSINTHDKLAFQLAKQTGFHVISVDYPLSPEYPYPHAINAVYSVINWVHDHSTSLNIDNQKMIIGGDSAGASISAAVCIKARDENGPSIWKQLLIYPAVDALVKDTYSRQTFTKDLFLTSEMLTFFENQYLPEDWMRSEPLVSMLYKANLENLPPAIILTAEFDPLRDDGELYAKKLTENGNQVEYQCFKGTIHGFVTIPGFQSNKAVKWIQSHL